MFERFKQGVARVLGIWQVVARGLFGAGQPVYPPSSTLDFMRLYQSDPWIFGSVWLIANSANRAPMRIKKPDGSFITKHKMLDVLARPNKRQTKRMFMEATFNYLELAGEVYWELVPNSFGTVEELYVMRPDRVRIIPSIDGRLIDSYEYFVGSESLSIPSEFVLPVAYFNPLDDWRGQPTVRPLANSVVMDRAADGWMARFMKRYGTKDGYLHTDLPGVGESEAKRLSKKWQERFDDVDHSPILPRGLKYDSYSEAPKQGGALDIDGITIQRKLATMGVPPVKLGLLKYAKGSGYDLQTRAFLLDTIWPKLEKVADAVNLHLLPKYPTLEGCEFEFYMSPTVFVDILGAIKELAQLFDRNALTVNELIEITGFGKRFEGGDMRYLELRKDILSMSTRSAQEQEEK